MNTQHETSNRNSNRNSKGNSNGNSNGIAQNNGRILLVAVVFFWFAQYVYIPFQTPYLTEIGTSAGMVGMIIGAYGISQMLLRLPVGVMADYRNRHKQFIMIGGISSGAASIFRVVMQNGTGFFIANLFSGLASAMWISFMVFYMSFYPTEQRKATSQLVLANNLGMLAGFVTSTLFYQKVGMPVICGFSIVAGVCCAVVASRLKEDAEIGMAARAAETMAVVATSAETERTAGTAEAVRTAEVARTAEAVSATEAAATREPLTVRNLLSVCTSRRLLIFAVLALVQQGVQMSTTMSFTTQIIKNLGANTMTIGISSIIYMLSAVLWAKFASTDLCGKMSSRNWISLVFCTTAAYCVLIPMSTSIPIICLLQILPGMATGILFSFLTSEAMKGIPAEKKSTAMGCFQAIYALGMTTFPMICGKIAGAVNMTAAYLFLAVICVVAAVGSRGFREKKAI